MKTAFEIAMEKDTGYAPLELTRKQIIACIRGAQWTGPNYWDYVRKCAGYGTFDDQHGWRWNDLSKLTEAELIHLYYIFF